MRMLREVIILSLLAMVALYVLNIAAASSMSAQVRSNSPMYRINITDVWIYTKHNPYPPKIPYQVPVKFYFRVYGNIIKDGKLINGDGKYLYHGEVISNVPNPTQWKIDILPNGSFDDVFQFTTAGRHDLIYTYFWGNSSTDFCQSDVISIYAVQQ